MYYYDTYYREYGSETFTADFSPCTEEWQFASVQFAKTKYRTIENIKVFCDYDHNTGTAYFNDIQLVRNSLETSLSASDFVVESTGESEENTETTDTTPTFNEAKDKFGNALTETTFTDGEFGTIYRAFGFTPDCNCVENAGNDLVSETDARGNKVLYTVDEDTSRNEEVTDRCGNKTAYEYDASGKTTKVISKDAEGNIVRSIDIVAKKEYNYEYEEGNFRRATEANIRLDGEIVVSRTVVNTTRHYYDAEGTLTKKVITARNGNAQEIFYETTEDNTVVKFSAGGRIVTSHSKTDTFGRKAFDELQLGTSFVSRQFSYHTGEVTDTHKAYEKVKSSPTTQLVSQIVLSGGRTISYKYDEEERITEVVDSVESTTTTYTYDALGQLLTETVNGEVVNEMTYDNYGNILTKNGNTYTYGDGVWKDKLTAYCGRSITYDAQGNPTNYLGYHLTWEKGRQLKSFGSNTYTYNANGIRTSKTVDCIEHTYTLDGAKILREEWDGNTLIPLYDNEDSVCGILYNSEPFYFQKNLQGDVIAIVNKEAEEVARYTYDAWGVCTIQSDFSGCSIAVINPFRYRGYYYDDETGLYYVSSRYYNPEIGRFLNSDEAITLAFGGGKIGHNLFNYCENNPVNNKDISGYIAANIVGAAIGAIIGVVGGAFLGNWLADVLKLSGWKRGIFVAAVAALVGAAAGAIGYFIGPYVAKIAVKLGKYIANLVRKGKIALKKMSANVKSSLRSLFKETCCFVAGTQISTPAGEKAIEKISVGDSVYAANPETGEIGIKKVTKVFIRQAYTLYHVVTSSEEIVTTDEHPFWVNGKGWVAARSLCQGDTLCLQSKETVEIIDVFVETMDSPITVYNFEVEGWHTYFVGTNKILVHNKCSLTKIKDNYLKQKGFDAHAIKKEFVGKNNISKYDMYYDKDSGLIFLLRKGAKAAEAIATGYFIK